LIRKVCFLLNSTIKLVTDPNGDVLSSDLYSVKTPPLLTAVMLDFINSLGVKQLLDFCIGQVPRSFKTDVTQSPLKWDMQKCPLPDTLDMYWISPADTKSHFKLFSYLGTGCFDVILTAIASVCDQHVAHLTVYQLTFMVVSYCSETCTMMTLLLAMSGLSLFQLFYLLHPPPELAVKNGIITKVEHPVKYNLDESLVWDPEIEHSTSILSCNGNYQVCISTSVAFITPLYVKQIMMDVTQKFLPRKSGLLLQWARSPHWSRTALPGDSKKIKLY
jgi:hypothetical protein